MDLIINLEHRFYKTNDNNKIWTSSAFSYEFWQPYLKVFDNIKVIARVKKIENNKILSQYKESNGERVYFIEIPYYIGPFEYLKKLSLINKTIKNINYNNSCFIFRLPSQLGYMVLKKICVPLNYPYGLEIVGDPDEVFKPGIIKHPLREFFRIWFSYNLKKACQKAVGVSYVTQHYLQRKYPVKNKNIFITNYSDVVIEEQDIKKNFRKKDYYENKEKFTIIAIASLEQPYKGIDILIESVYLCLKDNLKLQLIIIGDGKYRKTLEEKAKELKIEKNIKFLGYISQRQKLFSYIDQSDIFIIPSLTEGLPRVLIEAMARGIPCIGSNVGGIKELLKKEYLVPPKSPSDLYNKIKEVLKNPSLLEKMSKENLEIAQNFKKDILLKKRIEFYNYIKEKTKNWLKNKNYKTAFS